MLPQLILILQPNKGARTYTDVLSKLLRRKKITTMMELTKLQLPALMVGMSCRAIYATSCADMVADRVIADP